MEPVAPIFLLVLWSVSGLGQQGTGLELLHTVTWELAQSAAIAEDSALSDVQIVDELRRRSRLPRIIARIDWPSTRDLRAQVLVFRTDGTGPRVQRELRFAPGDRPAQRERAVGLVVVASVRSLERPDVAGDAAGLAAPDVAGPAGSVAPPPLPAADRQVITVMGEAQTVSAAWAGGVLASYGVQLVPRLRIDALAAMRFGTLESLEGTYRALVLGAGATSPLWSAPAWGVAAGAAVLAVREDARFEPSDGSSSAGARWNAALRATVEGRLHLWRRLWAVLAAGIEVAVVTRELLGDDSATATLGRWRLLAGLGLQLGL